MASPAGQAQCGAWAVSVSYQVVPSLQIRMHMRGSITAIREHAALRAPWSCASLTERSCTPHSVHCRDRAWSAMASRAREIRSSYCSVVCAQQCRTCPVGLISIHAPLAPRRHPGFEPRGGIRSPVPMQRKFPASRLRPGAFEGALDALPQGPRCLGHIFSARWDVAFSRGCDEEPSRTSLAVPAPRPVRKHSRPPASHSRPRTSARSQSLDWMGALEPGRCLARGAGPAR